MELTDEQLAALGLNRQQYEDILQRACDAYWASIVKDFPTVESGDFPPDAQESWNEAKEKATGTWLFYNHPDMPQE